MTKTTVKEIADSYERDVLDPADAGPVQRKETRRIFYAAFQIAMATMSEIAVRHRDDEKAAAAEIEELYQECAAFHAALMQEPQPEVRRLPGDEQRRAVSLRIAEITEDCPGIFVAAVIGDEHGYSATTLWDEYPGADKMMGSVMGLVNAVRREAQAQDQEGWDRLALLADLKPQGRPS